MRALITRPQPDADAFAALCRAQGIEPVIAPLMQTVMHERAIDLAGVGALAFTSANGVRAFADNSVVRDLPVFAVGEATAAAALAAGFGVVETADGDVAALAAMIGAKWRDDGGAVLHAAGSRRAGDLLSLLQRRDVAARREVLYEMREASSLPQAAVAVLDGAQELDWVALFSPRSAELFAALVEKAELAGALAALRAACLSDAAAAPLRRFPWRDMRIANRRSAEAMIDLMTQNA